MEGTSSARPWWRRGAVAWALIPAVLFVVLLSVAAARKSGPPATGDEAPDFSGPLLNGSGTFGLANVEGRPFVLNFWASWCEPCKDEAPMLRRAAKAYGDEVDFVGIDIRDARSDALKFVADNELVYPHVRDDGLKIYQDYGLTGQPETFFVDAQGIIVEHVNGPLSQDALDQLLNVLVSRSG
ncbi:MAG: cytochrome c biosis protein CcmG, thiol:disulfide interchange protein DsbE [Actinomycetota bacterium]|nr:cytochrome c biosis protein CcmG, thiol:disulfide interchange protein DsbE [Actinomycetota bacterium]